MEPGSSPRVDCHTWTSLWEISLPDLQCRACSCLVSIAGAELCHGSGRCGARPQMQILPGSAARLRLRCLSLYFLYGCSTMYLVTIGLCSWCYCLGDLPPGQLPAGSIFGSVTMFSLLLGCSLLGSAIDTAIAWTLTAGGSCCPHSVEHG